MAGLVALLKGGLGRVQEAAAAAVETLLQHAACQSPSAAHVADLAAALVQVLRTGGSGSGSGAGSSTSEAQTHAAGVIALLAVDPVSCLVLEQQPGLVGGLVALLSSSNSSSSNSGISVQGAALTALLRLAEDEGLAHSILAEPGAVAGLSGLLRNGAAQAQQQAAAVVVV
jgi:hypothetical protein